MTTKNATTLRLVAPEDKKKLRDRLGRIEGQIRGIQRMIDEEDDCERVAQQLAAASQAIRKAFSDLIARTIENNCMSPENADPHAREKLAELVKILAKYA